MVSMVEWGIGIDRREFRSKATERGHVIHTSAYPNESVHKLTLSIISGAHEPPVTIDRESTKSRERRGGGGERN